MDWLTTSDIKVGIGRGATIEHLALRDGPNLIDTLDNGRQAAHADIIEGWPGREVMGNPWRQDCINPTQGGGIDDNQAGSEIVVNVLSPNSYAAEVVAKDYTAESYNGDYRQEFATIWPRTHWRIRVSYEVSDNEVRVNHKLWHEDSRDHYFRQARVATYLRSDLFQPPWGNERNRVLTSYRQAEIDDHLVWHASRKAGAAIFQETSWVQPGETKYQADARSEDDIMHQGAPGRCQVMLMQSVYRRLRWIPRGEVIEANTVLTVAPFTQRKFFVMPPV